MKTQILNLIKTDHELLKQWTLGLSDPNLLPIVARIDVPEGDRKKIIFVLPSFLQSHSISSKKSALIMVLKHKKIVTLYYCDHPNYLFKKEKNSEFQIIY